LQPASPAPQHAAAFARLAQMVGGSVLVLTALPKEDDAP
jgi:hypothetical protein